MLLDDEPCVIPATSFSKLICALIKESPLNDWLGRIGSASLYPSTHNGRDSTGHRAIFPSSSLAHHSGIGPRHGNTMLGNASADAIDKSAGLDSPAGAFRRRRRGSRTRTAIASLRFTRLQTLNTSQIQPFRPSLSTTRMAILLAQTDPQNQKSPAIPYGLEALSGYVCRHPQFTAPEYGNPCFHHIILACRSDAPLASAETDPPASPVSGAGRLAYVSYARHRNVSLRCRRSIHHIHRSNFSGSQSSMHGEGGAV